MGQFKKGQSGNAHGRPKGSKNKSNEEIRTLIENFLHKNIKTIQADWEKLNVKDKMKFLVDLLPYGVPKLRPAEEKDPNELDWSETDLEKKFYLPQGDPKRRVLDLEKLPTDLLEQIVEEIDKAEAEGRDIYQ